MSCNNCQYFHKSSTVAIVGGNLVITFADAPTGIVDTTKFCFVICQSIPTGVTGLPVQLVINGVNTPMWNKYGDIVTGEDLVTRCAYKGYYGTQTVATVTTNHVIAVNTPKPACNCCV